MKGICRSLALCMALAGICSCKVESDPGDFTKEETALIRTYSEYADASVSGSRTGELCMVPPGTMRVLTIKDEADSAVLRDTSRCLSAKALKSEEYEALTRLMVATVTHPSQDGVGIAGPQVGLNRRVVAVQRFDKGTTGPDGQEIYPFEIYPNIRIVWASDSLAYGPEGCLSVPDRRGDVLRSQEIVIEYTDMERLLSQDSRFTARQGRKAKHPSLKGCKGVRHDLCNEGCPTRRDTVRGFTAVIFQHETDHLDGVLYIDRL